MLHYQICCLRLLWLRTVFLSLATWRYIQCLCSGLVLSFTVFTVLTVCRVLCVRFYNNNNNNNNNNSCWNRRASLGNWKRNRIELMTYRSESRDANHYATESPNWRRSFQVFRRFRHHEQSQLHADGVDPRVGSRFLWVGSGWVPKFLSACNPAYRTTKSSTIIFMSNLSA